MKVVLAGAGAFGMKHLDGVEKIDGVMMLSGGRSPHDDSHEVTQADG